MSNRLNGRSNRLSSLKKKKKKTILLKWPPPPLVGSALVICDANEAPSSQSSWLSGGGGGGGGEDAVAQQHSSTNTDELTVVAVEAASSLQLLHDVRMHAIGAAVDDDDTVFRCGCGGFRNRSDAAGNSCSVCLGTSEKLSWLPPLGDMHGVGWITCNGHNTTTRIIIILIYTRRFFFHGPLNPCRFTCYYGFTSAGILMR